MRGRHLDVELLSTYLDEELAPEETQAVERHLRACPQCEERLSGLRRSVESLRVLGRAVPPAEVLLAVERKVAAEPRRAPGLRIAGALVDRLEGWLRWPALRPGFAGALVVVLAAGVTLVYLGFGRQEPRSAVPDAEGLRIAFAPLPSPVASPTAVRSAPPSRLDRRARTNQESAAPGPSDRVAGGRLGGAPGGMPTGAAPQAVELQAAPPPAAPRPGLAGAESKRDARRALEEKSAMAAGERSAAAPGAPEGLPVAAAPPAVSESQSQDALRVEALAKAAPPATRTLGGRTFLRDARGWREAGLAVDVTPSEVMGSDGERGRFLLARQPFLRTLLTPGNRIVLRLDGRILELRGPAAPDRR